MVAILDWLYKDIFEEENKAHYLPSCLQSAEIFLSIVYWTLENLVWNLSLTISGIGSIITGLGMAANNEFDEGLTTSERDQEVSKDIGKLRSRVDRFKRSQRCTNSSIKNVFLPWKRLTFNLS
ncbi:hypothetical protein DID80_06035 [Candidatus Marinamargulisbacteria bacterium SCGC AAA071-K20]|nr:hypothetical protein DID80_06035 [Candidatus Marinamargulisbacteria bacterium SCGC AAA071-K20]